MQNEQLRSVHFHVFDVLPKYFVGALDLIVARREVDVALGEIGVGHDSVFVGRNE